MRIFKWILSFVLLMETCGTAMNVYASPWYEHYIAHEYKVKVTKPVKVMKIKYGSYTYKNTFAKKFKLHKGEVVYTHFAGAGGMEWPMHSKRYKPSTRYGYSAHFTKGSFKVLKVLK